MPRTRQRVDIFAYEDFRLFLKDWYAAAKKWHRGISFRSFSSKAGFGSPNFLKRIIDGTRNLSAQSILAVAKGMELNKQETEFFINLVSYNQATNHEEKNIFYKHLVSSQKVSRLKPLQKDQYEYCSRWYHPVIRELIASHDFHDDWTAVGQCLSPSLTPEQVERSVELLARLGFIKKDEQGQWIQSEPVITSGAETKEISVINYHQNVLCVVKEKLPYVPAEARDVSALTLGVTEEMIPEIKERIASFRKDILKLVTQDPQTDEVVLLTIQLMPVAKTKRGNPE